MCTRDLVLNSVSMAGHSVEKYLEVLLFILGLQLC